ncbi:hypothetical protein [Zooshikella sp. RANM57]|uniref:hypothetical protein n=1 Tax=Zooshikella sp. RANM57 TaxID=3425863 RepID=UPI003D6DFC91
MSIIQSYNLKTVGAVIVAFTIIVLSYSPSFKGGYLFDDYANITKNPFFNHNSIITIESIRKAAFSNFYMDFNRPLAMASLYLDYKLSGGDSTVQRVINLLIHLINMVLVYLVLKKISTVYLLNLNSCELVIMSLIWGILPINVSAVAYIVQRMTLLSFFFSILSILIYFNYNERRGVWRIFLMFFCVFLGFLCKENSLVALAVIFFYDWVFKGDLYKAMLVLFLVVSILFIINYEYFFSGYDARVYTPYERIITQSRIIFLYLKSIIIPDYNELSLYHDDVVPSESIFRPLTTLVSLLVLLVVFLFCLIKNKTLVSFGVAWFLLGHSIESTILPLELAFEHRNYFPSVGIVISFMALYKKASLSGRLIVISSYIVFLSMSTYSYSKYWGGEIEAILKKAYRKDNSLRQNMYAAHIYVAEYDQAEGVVKEKYADLVRYFFNRAKKSYNSGLSPYFDQIIFESRSKKYFFDESFEKIMGIATLNKIDQSSINSFYNLTECIVKVECVIEDGKYKQIFDALYSNQSLNNTKKSELLLRLSKKYYSENKIDMAIAVSLKASELDVQNINAYLHLHKYLYEYGDIDKAQYYKMKVKAYDRYNLF